MPHIANLKEIQPLDHYKATFDLFYEFVKGQVKGDIKANQYLQLQTIAEPLDFAKHYRWFSYFTYLNKVDQTLKPEPLSDQFTVTNRTLAREYERFVETALQLVEAIELPPEVVSKINAEVVRVDNIKKEVRRLVREDADAWKEYAELRGIPYGDLSQYLQWSNRYGNANDIDAQGRALADTYGTLERLRRQQYSDVDQRDIKEAWDKMISIGSRIRYPRRPDDEYADGSKFSLPYLASLPTGDTAQYADRPVIFPDLSFDTIVGGSNGQFSIEFNEFSTAKESMSVDWSSSVSGSYGWFSASVNASSSTKIEEEFSHTKDVTLGCKACMIVPVQPPSWFDPNLFGNKLILKNKRTFERYLGPKGTLLYYPTALVVMRGFNVLFKSTNTWKYDYVRDFSVGGSGSARFFGIGLGGGYKRHEHQEKHHVEKNGNELRFSDGDLSLRVLGYIAQKNTSFETDVLADLSVIKVRP
ncbi:hypothetical protein D3C77_303410 [compost metagenome]